MKAVLFDCFGVLLDVTTNQRDDTVIDFVRSLKGSYRLALVSNISSRQSLDRYFAPNELDELFDAVIPSGDVGYEKPDDGIYWAALNALDVLPEEAIFTDDISRFVDAAQALGIQSIVFESAAVSLPKIKALLEETGLSDSVAETAGV